MSYPALFGAALGSIALLSIGCQILSGASDISFSGAGGADAGGHAGGPSGGAGGDGGSDGGEGGTGGMEPQYECIVADDCALETHPECTARRCTNGSCDPLFGAKGNLCEGSNYCDGMGACVQCSDTHMANCGVDDVCEQGVCVPMDCKNTVQDPGETGIDCGGPDCPACADGGGCTDPSDCLSGVCDDNNCAPCADTPQCEAIDANDYCEGGVCLPKLAVGSSCSLDEQCQDGHCVDGVCCSSACDGKCQRCNGVGQCVEVGHKTDPDGDCPGSEVCCTAGSCNGQCTALGLCPLQCL